MSDATPPTTPKATTGVASLTAREAELLGKAWSCLKTGPPEIDYEKLAGEMGMTNPRSAANAWGAIKKKMAWTTAAQPATGGKSTGGKRKKAATTDDDGDDQATPTKKAKATPTKAPRKKATLRPKTPAVAKDSDSDNEGTAAGDEETKAEPEVKAEPEANNEDEDEGI